MKILLIIKILTIGLLVGCTATLPQVIEEDVPPTIPPIVVPEKPPINLDIAYLTSVNKNWPTAIQSCWDRSMSLLYLQFSDSDVDPTMHGWNVVYGSQRIVLKDGSHAIDASRVALTPVPMPSPSKVFCVRQLSK